jgi:activator of HSP90 ATPase
MEEKDRIADKPQILGFQFSIRKTFPISVDMLWEFILSEEGFSVWLGEIDMNDFELNKSFKTAEGIEGKMTVFKPDCHFRLSWKPTHWEKPSTIEIRITNSKGKASVVIHQTRLYTNAQREEMKIYWKSVIDRMEVELARE